MLQTKLEDARDGLSAVVEDVFYELGQLYVEGYGGDGWGCTQSVREDSTDWMFKYTTDDDEVQFVRAEYTYEVPEFELDGFYNLRRVGTERKERDAYVVSQYDPANVWEVLHTSETLFDAIGSFLSDLTSFPTHPKTADGVLDENDALKTAIQSLKDEHESFIDTVETVQEGMSMEDLVVSTQEDYEDLAAIGICDDEEDKDSVWKMFNCTAPDGLQSTKRNIKFTNESIALVEVERWYNNEWYSVAYVVGADDGDTPFFIHRLQSADEVTETDEWTAEEVYDLMGFDCNLDSDEIGYGTRYRVQGDVYFERRELQSEKEEFAEVHAKNTVRDAVQEYADEFLEEQGLSEYFSVNTYIRNHLNSNEEDVLLRWQEDYGTDTLKDLQEDMNIPEDKVRQMQDQREWNRLSQKRRRTIIRDILEERLFQWANQQYGVSVDELWDDALEEQRNEFENPEASCPITLGNHLLNIRSALIHPNSTRRLEEDIEVVVPQETQLYVLHDEHNSKIVTLPEGVYTFGFLDQHFNA